MSKLSFSEKLAAESKATRLQRGVNRGALSDLSPDGERRSNYLGYQVSTTTADEIKDWVVFKGDPEAGRSLKDYRHLGLVSVWGLELSERLDETPTARLAVIWAVGRAVMVAGLPRPIANRDIGTFTYAMRLTRTDLLTAPALWSPEDKSVWVPSESQFRIVNVMDRSEAAVQLPRTVTVL